MNKLILFELNEVPIRIMDYYREIRPNSWLAKNFSQLKKFESFSENEGHLSPWNTWPTLHRGVANNKHYISDFNQDMKEVDQEFPPIWKILTDQNINVGVFGSLHSFPLPEKLENYKFYIPDVFAPASECFPKSVELFQDINLKLSRKSARNVDNSIPFGDIFKLMTKANSLGFKLGTLSDVGGHLVNERFNKWKTVRRRTYQTVISFDVFYKLLTKTKPDFVTFFTNHVASSQHRYWAALFPDDYEKLKYDKEWISTYNNEILFTMDKTDAMLKKLANFISKNPEYKLIITSSMGQNAVESEPIETQLYVTNHEAFMAMFGLSKNDFEVKPAMLPQFNYSVSSEKINDFRNQLNNFTINGKSVSYRELGHDRFSIDLGHQNLKTVTLAVGGINMSLEKSGLKNVIIEDRSSATAYHIPEGHFYVYHPSFEASELSDTSIPTREIVPIILDNFGIKPKEYMQSVGKSIL